MTTQSPTLASQATAELPKLPRYSFSITKAEHGMNWKATPDPEGSLCLYAEVQAAFAASNPSQETAELPKLPAFPIIVGRPWDAQDAIDYAHAAMQAGYEAGRASRAQSEWQPIETAPKTGRTLLLGYFNALGKWRTLRGQWFTDAVIQEEWTNSDVHEAGWFETSVECDDEDSGCWPTDPTHWQPLPSAPATLGETK